MHTIHDSGPAVDPLHDLTLFFQTSASLRYQLDAASGGIDNILSVILGTARFSDREETVLRDVISYLIGAYGRRRRRIGPPAVLHPLRTGALVVRAVDPPNLLDLLTALLHDKLEDLTDQDLGARWEGLEHDFQELLKSIDPTQEWFLMERLDWLTRDEDQSYNAYIGELVVHAEETPEILRAKLADRLDNTLDMRVAVVDPIDGVDFFEAVFRIMFLNHTGYQSDLRPNPTSMSEASRLYQLFKNTVMLSLVRQRGVAQEDRAAHNLFLALAQASMKEAQRIVLHIFSHHLVDAKEQRSLLMETMRYVQAGGVDQVTALRAGARLDGLFRKMFDCAGSVDRHTFFKHLDADKPKMIAGGIAFVVIFLRFLNDPDYWVHNVTPKGIELRA